ncbi:MAG: helix-turn-helix domain-containing protein [Actinomycetota bacterium]|nr:helix-turn-helix domain-containing protein [Actinomycetota bacterium]
MLTARGMTLGELMRARREERGLGQGDLARHCGVTQQTVSRWEQGIGTPRPARITQLAEVLGLDATTLHQVSGYLPAEAQPTADPRHLRLDQLTENELLDLLDLVGAELRGRRRRA